MLSRRHLRIKALHAIYAFIQSDNDRLDLGEKFMLQSLDKLYDLYIYQFSFIIEIFEYAGKRIDEARNKFYPTEEEKNPNLKFIENQLYLKLAENIDLQKKIDRLRINWSDEWNMIRKILLEIRETPEYNEYMDNGDHRSFNEDKQVVIKLFSKYVATSESLQSYYEEKDIFWSVDYETANFLVVKTLKDFKEKDDEFKKLPGLFKNNVEEEVEIPEDKSFMVNLFRKMLLHSKEYESNIREKLKNWELERVALMDMIIIKMALTELLEFPTIPVKVTINEYIDLSKIYSTPKSKSFINGILDQLVSDLKAKNQIKKTGRGLLDH